jgi:hypothetical protein
MKWMPRKIFCQKRHESYYVGTYGHGSETRRDRPLVYELVKSVRIQKIERRHHYIRGKMLSVMTDADASHTRAARSLDSGGRIFYDDGPAG